MSLLSLELPWLCLFLGTADGGKSADFVLKDPLNAMDGSHVQTYCRHKLMDGFQPP